MLVCIWGESKAKIATAASLELADVSSMLFTHCIHSEDLGTPSLIQINPHAPGHELLSSLCVLPHFRSIELHLRPVALL